MVCVLGALAKLVFLQAAVLHDTVEDTDTSYEELEKTFGPEVKGIVNEVSDDKSLPKMERKALQVFNSTFHYNRCIILCFM